MKKSGVFVVLLLLLFSLIPFVFAEVGDNCTVESDCGLGESCVEDQCVDDTAPVVDDKNDSIVDDEASDNEKIDEAFTCLEEKVGDCTKLSTQELALTIMATPKDDVFDDCVKELGDRKKNDNWGNIRDTGLAILALDHAGENTEASEDWLLEKAKAPTDLIWYLEQDSREEVECHVKYDSSGYDLNVGEDKKIDQLEEDGGPCLSKAQSNFWLKIDPGCYQHTYKIECDHDFIATLLYKNKNSPTIYVLEGTENSPAFDEIELKVNSKCFGDTSCDYEGTLWATLALLQTGHEIDEYVPYIIAMSNTNKQYLPDSFIYALTSYEDYATNLIEDQELGDYWYAPNSAYNKFYDTSLALLSVGDSSSEKIIKARDWLLFSRGSNGCWGNSIRDTAISLWALAGRAGRSSVTGSTTTYCNEANFFCIPREDCTADGDDVGDNFYCSGTSNTCCKTENLKTCEEYSGEVCKDGFVCTGNERKSLDESACCTGSCIERGTDEPEVSECVDFGYSCEDSCSDTQEEVDRSCDGAGTCCKTKRTDTSEGSLWWLWVLIILILIVGGAIAYVKREALKLWWFKTRSKFKKDNGKDGSNKPGMGPGGIPPRPGSRPGPRPGFPPVRRPAPRVAPQRRNVPKRNPEMDETFKKLRQMAQK